MIFGVKESERAYAKINLFLDVCGKRGDGYHNIRSIMQSVSLYDNINLELKRDCVDALTCNIEGIPTDGKNLAVKAVNAFRAATGLSFGTEIHIEKNIPFAAGLAGGSSDAAAVLRILSRLCEIPTDDSLMTKIAASIGADVPFCFFGGTVLAEGIGEMLTPVEKCPRMHCVVAIKGEGVSTPEAYSRLDLMYGDFEGERDNGAFLRLKKALQEGDETNIKTNLFNVFESAIESERAEVGKLKKIMSDCGAQKTLMSGSGPSVFGIFGNESIAKTSVKALEKYGAKAYYCTTK